MDVLSNPSLDNLRFATLWVPAYMKVDAMARVALPNSGPWLQQLKLAAVPETDTSEIDWWLWCRCVIHMIID
eukprot:5666854-Amphidinium_carterae.1